MKETQGHYGAYDLAAEWLPDGSFKPGFVEEYLADFADRLGYLAVQGSSSRGGVRALIGAIRVLRAGGTVGFTPDGPRGPRRELKPGFLAAAQRIAP